MGKTKSDCSYRIDWAKCSNEIYTVFKTNVMQKLDKDVGIARPLPILDENNKEVVGYEARLRIKPYSYENWYLDVDLFDEKNDKFVYIGGVIKAELGTYKQFKSVINDSFEEAVKNGLFASLANENAERDEEDDYER